MHKPKKKPCIMTTTRVYLTTTATPAKPRPKLKQRTLKTTLKNIAKAQETRKGSTMQKYRKENRPNHPNWNPTTQTRPPHQKRREKEPRMDNQCTECKKQMRTTCMMTKELQLNQSKCAKKDQIIKDQQEQLQELQKNINQQSKMLEDHRTELKKTSAP